MKTFVLSVFVILSLSACSSEPETDSTDDDSPGDLRTRDRTNRRTDIGAYEDPPREDSNTETDSATDTGITTDIPSADSTDRSGPEEDVGPGPANVSVACQTDSDCPAEGADSGVCCTHALNYQSFCSTESACTGGDRDACLTDEQCSARRPGQWTVCCHDRGAFNYCAPLIGTCQPLTLCNTPTDCIDAERDYPCCSTHDYYQERYCTSEFLAGSPATDCPN